MDTLRRRCVTIPAVLLAGPIWFLLSPLVLPIVVVVDLVTGHRKLPMLRLWFFTIVFVAHEWIGVAYAAWLWVTGGFGLRPRDDRYLWMQDWWSSSLLTWAGRVMAVRFDWGDAPMPPGRVIVLSRHASMVDAIVPAHLFLRRLGRPVHYVLKRELRNIPNLDLYGHRLGNHFVDRAGETAHEVARIGELSDGARPDAGIVIFPEGTYATPEAKQRIGRALERKGDLDAARLNDELRFLLPPKPAGALALLARRPDAPVVLLAHTGLEGVAEFRGLRRTLPLTEPVIVRWWQVDANAIPDTPDAQVLWLRERWRELDDWVGRHRTPPSTTSRRSK